MFKMMLAWVVLVILFSLQVSQADENWLQRLPANILGTGETPQQLDVKADALIQSGKATPRGSRDQWDLYYVVRRYQAIRKLHKGRILEGLEVAKGAYLSALTEYHEVLLAEQELAEIEKMRGVRVDSLMSQIRTRGLAVFQGDPLAARVQRLQTIVDRKNSIVENVSGCALVYLEALRGQPRREQDLLSVYEQLQDMGKSYSSEKAQLARVVENDDLVLHYAHLN